MKVVFSTIRWPDELYEQIKELAHKRRKSINKTVIDIITESLKGQ